MRFKDKVGVYLLCTRNQALTLTKKLPLNGILPAKQKLLMSVTVATGVVAIYSLLYWVDWAGFGPDSNKSKSIEKTIKDGKIISIKETETEQFQSGKTLWDWLGLAGTLAIPIVLFQFERSEHKRNEERAKAEKEQADKQVLIEKEIADTNQREEALQAYIDRMSELLLDKQLKTLASDNPLRDTALKVARARTLSILRRLDKDGERKGRIIRFLIDAELISELNLSDADLSGINLSGINLSRANLELSTFQGAILEAVTLFGANLSSANLQYAKLERADLRDVNL